MAAADSPILELRAFSTGIGETVHLHGLQIVVSPAEIVAITGPSGSGKTTLLRTMAGLIPALGGTRWCDGQAQPVATPAFRSRHIYLNQTPAFHDVSVGDALERPCAYQANAACRFVREDAAEELRHLLLAEADLDKQVRTLSIGEQQRVALVRALLLKPRLLLLDEPTSALDPDGVTRAEDRIRRFVAKERRGAVLVSHDPTQVERFADRVVDLTSFAVAP